jgi:hypothetical protein
MPMLYVASGDMDEAFAWLNKASEQRDASLVWSDVAPESDLLRSDCRFQQFLERMNLFRNSRIAERLLRRQADSPFSRKNSVLSPNSPKSILKMPRNYHKTRDDPSC